MRTDGGCAIASFPLYANVTLPLNMTPESQAGGANPPSPSFHSMVESARHASVERADCCHSYNR